MHTVAGDDWQHCIFYLAAYPRAVQLPCKAADLWPQWLLELLGLVPALPQLKKYGARLTSSMSRSPCSGSGGNFASGYCSLNCRSRSCRIGFL